MIRNIVLVDLDHTISDAAWRDPMIAAGDWDAYHAEFCKDKPCTDMIHLVNSLAICGFNIVGLTARPAKWRKATMDWLFKHGVKMHDILMRPDEDFHPAPALKLKLAERLMDRVLFVVDDREDVVAAFNGAGVTALMVKGRNY